MAQVRSLIQDQNLNVHFDGASAGGKANMLKAPRKGAVSSRKPLGDLSNSVKPTPNQSLKKQQTGARKALTDISNKSKQKVQEAPKKDVKTKVRVVEEEEEDLKSIAEEGFLHNHEECIKARTRAMDTDEFLKIVGLGNNSGFSRKLAPSPPWKPASPLKFTEIEEMSFNYLEDRHDSFSDLDSPPLSPKSLSPLWRGNADVNFMLIDSP